MEAEEREEEGRSGGGPPLLLTRAIVVQSIVGSRRVPSLIPVAVEALESVDRHRLTSHAPRIASSNTSPYAPLSCSFLPNHLSLLINGSNGLFKRSSNEHVLERLPSACTIVVLCMTFAPKCNWPV